MFNSRLKDVSRRKEHRQLRLRILCWCVALLLGFVQAWASRHGMNPDGISYLDVGDAYFRGTWHTAINGYWSPLYSWLLGLSMWLVRPPAYSEFVLVHILNFAVYLFGLACFDFFLSTFIAYQQRNHSLTRAGIVFWEEAWLALGFTLFIWSSLRLITLQLVTPDMCVAGLVYLAAGILVRIRGGHTSSSTFAILGAVLGIGYLAKAPMFPLAFVFLGSSAVAVGKLNRTVTRVFIGLMTFAVVTGPYLLAVSNKKGGFTFGDSGKLNYAEYVSGVTRYVHWQGQPRGTGSPKHPTRKLLDYPPMYEFASPIGGTYPPWYDQSYWYEGVVARVDLKRQLEALGANATAYAGMLVSEQAGLLIGFLVLFFLTRRKFSLLKGLAKQSHLLIPSLAALAMFGLVHVESRYIASFVVLLWVALFSGIAIPDSRIFRKVMLCVFSAVIIVLGIQCAKGTARDLITIAQHPVDVQWQVAEGLHVLGIQPGDKVASIGYSFGAYWARLARVSIVAEIPADIDSPGTILSPVSDNIFWESSCDVQSRVVEKFAQTGVKAIIGEVHQHLPSKRWIRVGQSAYYTYMIPQQRQASGGTGSAGR